MPLAAHETFVWAEMVPVLSMDIAERFFKGMGIVWASSEQWQHAARKVVGSNWQYLRDPLHWEHTMIRDEMLLSSGSVVGKENTDAFAFWIMDTVRPALRVILEPLYRHRRIYRSALGRWRAAMNAQGVDRAGIGTHAAALLRLCEPCWDMTDVRQQIEESQKLRLSPWDRRLYRTLSYFKQTEKIFWASPGAEVGYLLRGPFRTIVWVIEEHRFQEFWRQLIELFPDSVLVALRAYAETQFQEMLARTTPLAPPRELL